MKKLILVIDDEPELLELILDTLGGEGYEAIGASDAYSGLQRAFKSKPDLIIMDINMPAGGGLKAYNNLRGSAYTSQIPVIFISAYVGSKILETVEDGSMVDYLAKPIKRADLLSKVQLMLASKENNAQGKPENAGNP